MIQTELKMVNSLLEAIEETTIQTVDLTHPDVQLAINIWAEQSVAVQSRGWWYNKEIYQLVPDTNTGEVFLPNGTLEIDGAALTYVKRGRVLYDLENHTRDLSAVEADDLEMTCIMEWDLTELPPGIYRLVLLQAKLAMVTDRDQDQTKIQKYREEIGIAFATALQINLRFTDPNRQSVNNARLLLDAQTKRL